MSCAWCGIADEKILAACTGCHAVFYCGSRCQSNDWSSSPSGTLRVKHQDQCHLLAEVVEIGARLVFEHDAFLIGKRTGSDLEEEDDRPQKTTRQTESVPVPVVVPVVERPALYPLPRDITRLIALMTLVDAGSLMRASPAWRVLYEQIDWKAAILSRWDAPMPREAFSVDGDVRSPVQIMPIGQWLHENSIFRLYPDVLLDRSLYSPSPSQNERILYIIQERFRLEAEAIETGMTRVSELDELNRLESQVESEILLNRVQAIPRERSLDVQHALMNICILYRMYEHNEAVILMRHTGPREQVAYFTREDFDSVIELGSDDTTLFFPVEMLTKNLKYPNGSPLVDIVRREWGQREDPKSLVQLDRYFAYLESAGVDVRADGNRFAIKGYRLLNFPRAVTMCSNVFRNVVLVDCAQWSEASFRNLAKMRKIVNLLTVRGQWSEMQIDFLATCPRLALVSLVALPYGVKMTVSTSAMLQFEQAQGIFAVRRAFQGIDMADNFTLETESAPLSKQYQFKRSRQRIIPPAPFGGLSRDAHVERIIESAFSPLFVKKAPSAFKEDRVLFERLMQALLKRRLFPLPDKDPRSESEYVQLVVDFCVALESSGISPVPGSEDVDDKANIALPFRTWFNNGILYRSARSTGETLTTVRSRAQEACKLSAERRRLVGAYPSMEELAEALVAWRTSVYNLTVLVGRVEHPRYSYCYYIESIASDRDMMNFQQHLIDNDTVVVTERYWNLTTIRSDYVGPNHRLCVPHELAMVFVEKTASAMAPSGFTTSFVTLTLERFYGCIPAWLWLAHPSGWQTLRMFEFDSLAIPMQLMYHRGLRTLRIYGFTEWGTPDGQIQWDLFHLREESRPGPFVAYCHDFEELRIELGTQSRVAYLPLIDTARYPLGLKLNGFKNQ